MTFWLILTTIITVEEKKEEIWLSPMTNAPTLTEKFKKQRDNIKKRHQKLRLYNDCGPTKDGQLE